MTCCQVVEREVGEPLETFNPRRVHQDGDWAELLPHGGQRGVDGRAVGHVGGVRELVVGRYEVERGDVVPVGAQPIRDGLADARAASGDDGGLHEAALGSNFKNLPSEYENRTLAHGVSQDKSALIVASYFTPSPSSGHMTR